MNGTPILVAVATYNEIENLPTLVTAIHEALPKADVLVIDDDSPDGTGNWCQEFAERTDWFSVYHRPGKLGLGSALATAMKIAVEKKYEAMITLDADWSHPPSCLPALVEALSRADVVIGSRYCAGGGIEGWPWQRRLASRTINALARILLGTPVSDCSGNCRLYRTTLLELLPWENMQARGYAFIEEVLWHLHCSGARFAEVPIVFTERRAGKSKVNALEAWGALQTLLRLSWQRVVSFLPWRV
jgi:dolichol-phosphate mannosyltransferase